MVFVVRRRIADGKRESRLYINIISLIWKLDAGQLIAVNDMVNLKTVN